MDGYVRELRGLVGSKRICIPGVRALILNKKQELLLQLRRDMDLWGLPGGAVEMGETALEALRREIMEEASLEIIEAEPMALFSGSGQQFTYPNGDRVQGFAVAFIIRKWLGTLQADGAESRRLEFFRCTELPKNIMPIHSQTIEVFLHEYDGRFLLPT